MGSLKELDALEEYLSKNGYFYTREDKVDYTCRYLNRHQIIVFTDEAYTERWFDAICQPGSYGYEGGLLEIMGPAELMKSNDVIEGWLTAQEIMQRLEILKKG